MPNLHYPGIQTFAKLLGFKGPRIRKSLSSGNVNSGMHNKTQLWLIYWEESWNFVKPFQFGSNSSKHEKQ